MRLSGESSRLRSELVPSFSLPRWADLCARWARESKPAARVDFTAFLARDRQIH